MQLHQYQSRKAGQPQRKATKNREYSARYYMLLEGHGFWVVCVSCKAIVSDNAVAAAATAMTSSYCASAMMVNLH